MTYNNKYIKHFSEKKRFSLKGNRDYLHGTDFINFLLSILVKINEKNISSIKIKFKKKTKNNLIFSSTPKNLNLFSEIYLIENDSKKYPILVYEDEDSPINEYYEYDEKQYLNNCIIDENNKTNNFKKIDKYSLIENAISQLKILHLGLFKKDSRWYFVEAIIDYKNFCKVTRYKNFSLEMLTVFNDTITKSKFSYKNFSIATFNFFRY